MMNLNYFIVYKSLLLQNNKPSELSANRYLDISLLHQSGQSFVGLAVSSNESTDSVSS